MKSSFQRRRHICANGQQKLIGKVVPANKHIKTKIKRMGAIKTDKAIANASRAAGVQRKVVENVDAQVNRASPLTFLTVTNLQLQMKAKSSQIYVL